jgi:hypothetical protein
MRRTLLVVFFGLLLTLANPLLTVASADGLPAPPWGTWVWRTNLPIPNASLPALVTLHVDGTMTGSDGVMFGGPPSQDGTRMSPIQAVWEPTGWRRIGGTGLWLTFDQSGKLTGFGRSRSDLRLSRDGEQLEGEMFLETLKCTTPVSCPDPLDPAAVWVPNNPPSFTVSAKRLHRVPAGPLVP